MLRVPGYRPFRRASELPCPWLVCIADRDDLTPPQIAAELAGRVGRRSARYDLGHFDIYRRRGVRAGRGRPGRFPRAAPGGDARPGGGLAADGGRYSEEQPARIAQLVEHFHGKEGVVGSSPTPGFLS